MAIWQFDFMIIPNKKTDDRKRTKSWLNTEIARTSLEKLEENFQQIESWSNDILQFGKEDETCINILLEDGKTEEITCRIDLRDLTKEKLIPILNFIQEINGQIYFNRKVYDAEMDNLVHLVRTSSAAEFCADPKKYLLEHGKSMDEENGLDDEAYFDEVDNEFEEEE